MLNTKVRERIVNIQMTGLQIAECLDNLVVYAKKFDLPDATLLMDYVDPMHDGLVNGEYVAEIQLVVRRVDG